jgi:2'-hydroxyisoflavone reductase
MWAPVREEFAGIWDLDVERTLAAGLVCRPIEETARDTWAWLKDDRALVEEDGRINNHGLAPADEQRILAALHGRDASA